MGRDRCRPFTMGQSMKTFAFLFLLLFAACENEPSLPVVVSEDAGKIVIRNNSATPVYYAAFERNLLAFINWGAFCNDNNRVQPSKSSTISVTGSSGASGEEVVVFWWSDCVQQPGSSSLMGDNLNKVIVKIR